MRTIIVLLLLLVATPAHGGEWFTWDEKNTKLHVPVILSLYADMYTTIRAIEQRADEEYYCMLAGCGSGGYEDNYFLGEHPSKEEAKEYFGWTALAVTGIVWVLPPEYSYTFQKGTTTIEVIVTVGNILAYNKRKDKFKPIVTVSKHF